MYDIAIIGGGINGCGIARDAAGRGYSVLLAEKSDLASGTSSWSTKLVHGGLRYLEHYEFRLVREALAERRVLLEMAPHLIRPMRFVLPHHAGLRPAWLLRLGLFLYDHIGGNRALPGTKVLDLRRAPAGDVLKPGFGRAFEYSDCWVDDARLVVLNARDAASRGADIRTRSKMTSARRRGDHWLIDLEAQDGTGGTQASARLLINAAGPWADQVLTDTVAMEGKRRTRLVKGSHIVVPRIGTHDEAFMFQNADGRIVFAIPFEQDFTLIGTTDEDFAGDPGAARISDSETTYLCAAVNEYFAQPITPADVVWSYAGVRPLYDDGASRAQEATRDYVIESAGSKGEPQLINIFGGKITTYRRLAEAVLVSAAAAIGERTRGAWTEASILPGGDFAVAEFDSRVAALHRDYPFLDARTVHRLTRSYGTRAHAVLGDTEGPADLGEQFGAGLTEREVRYLVDQEWARTADDIVWRRSKLGLRMSEAEVARLEDWLAANRVSESALPATTPSGLAEQRQ